MILHISQVPRDELHLLGIAGIHLLMRRRRIRRRKKARRIRLPAALSA